MGGIHHCLSRGSHQSYIDHDVASTYVYVYILMQFLRENEHKFSLNLNIWPFILPF